MQEGNYSPAQTEFTILIKFGKKRSRQSVLHLDIFQKDVWVLLLLFKDILVLKMEPAQQGLLLHQKTPLESQKNHLLTSENKLIWHITPILFALT